MRQLRTITLVFVLILVLPCMFIDALAHPGRTDSDGGHYVGGTDEYHWHHGEAAHLHVDLDGDGDLDCTLTSSKHKTANLLWGIAAIVALFAFPILSMFIMELAGRYRSMRRFGISDSLGALAVFLGIVNFIGAFISYFILGDILEPKIKRLCDKLFAPKQSKSVEVEPPAEPERLCGTPLLEHSRARHKKFCIFLWGKSFAFLKSSAIPTTYNNCARTFAVLFYVAAKIMRSKSFSREIYAQLPDVIAESMQEPDERYVGAALRAYRQIAPELNTSGIDPLMPDGVDLLWPFLLSRLSSPDTADINVKPRFALVVANVIRNTNDFRESVAAPVVQYSISDLPKA